MFSLPFIQNAIEDYYIKQAEGQHGGSISDYYENQATTGAGFYSGVQYQKGYGLGGLLATLGHFVLPILKPVAKAVGRQALKAIPALAMDVMAGKPSVKVLSKYLHQGVSIVLFELSSRKQTKRKKANKT